MQIERFRANPLGVRVFFFFDIAEQEPAAARLALFLYWSVKNESVDRPGYFPLRKRKFKEKQISANTIPNI